VASKAYLEALMKLAKRHLPAWLYKDLHTEAMAATGGKARWGLTGKMDGVAKMALRSLVTDALKEEDDAVIKDVFVNLSTWFASASRRGDDLAQLTAAAKTLLSEMDRRKLQYNSSLLVVKAANGEKVEKDKGDSEAETATEDELLQISSNVRIIKAYPNRHVVMGPVADPYQVDAHGDWIPAFSVETFAHKFMERSRVINLQHIAGVDAVPVESFLLPYPTQADYALAMKMKAHDIFQFVYGDGKLDRMHSGTWLLGTKINDVTAWDLVEQGKLGAYSIDGWGKRSKDKFEPMAFVKKVIKIDIRMLL